MGKEMQVSSIACDVLVDDESMCSGDDASSLDLGGKTRPGEAQNTQTVGWDEQLIN